MAKGLTREDKLENIIKTLAKEIGAKVSFSKNDDVYLVSLDFQQKHLLDLRITRHTHEFCLECSDVNLLKVLNLVGFNDLYEILTKHDALPMKVVISKSIASRSLYILLAGREGIPSLPNIRVAIREAEESATSSYCRISRDENTCALLSDLISLGRELWKEFFGTMHENTH